MMKKQTNNHKNTGLKKEHFEILLEAIDTKFDIMMEGYQTLDNKIDKLDARVDGLSDELHSTRDELIFLINANIERSEERLTKKIEDGDNVVKESLIGHIDQKIDEVKDILNVHEDRLNQHDERLAKLEHKQ